MKCLTRIYVILLAFSLISLVGACERKAGKSVENTDVALLTVGDSSLMLADVVARIPRGITAEDSVELFNTIVDAWIQDMLLTEIAAENLPDMERIERMVSDYRNRLIMEEYRKRMRENPRRRRDDAEVSRYYEANADDMRLEHPVIKGIYIKVPSNADQIDRVRQWVFSGSRQSIDKLEKYGLKGAMQYDWFGDKWIDWNVVADQIPYRFYDADAFVESTVNFETEYNGSTYFLHISDYLKSGDVMPFEFASEQIKEILALDDKRGAERRLMQSLFDNAIESGKLKIVGFDPINHKLRKSASSLPTPQKQPAATDKRPRQK